MCVQDWRCMCTGVEVYLQRMKMYVDGSGGVCTQEWRCMGLSVEACVSKKEDVCAQQWRCVYTRMKVYMHGSGGVCTQEWRFICTGVKACVHKSKCTVRFENMWNQQQPKNLPSLLLQYCISLSFLIKLFFKISLIFLFLFFINIM